MDGDNTLLTFAATDARELWMSDGTLVHYQSFEHIQPFAAAMYHMRRRVYYFM